MYLLELRMKRIVQASINLILLKKATHLLRQSLQLLKYARDDNKIKVEESLNSISSRRELLSRYISARILQICNAYSIKPENDINNISLKELRQGYIIINDDPNVIRSGHAILLTDGKVIPVIGNEKVLGSTPDAIKYHGIKI